MYTPSKTHKIKVLQEATRIIVERLNPVVIYHFGSKKNHQSQTNTLFPARTFKNRHFYLLVFVDDIPTNAIADVSNIIHDKSFGTVSVTLLLHSTTAFKKAFGNQDHFFHKVLNNGQELYTGAKPLVKEYQTTPVSDHEASQKYWHNRKTIAENFLNAAHALTTPEAAMVRQAMLHNVVEQTCLGLIDLFMGYRPNHFALPYLFDICNLFTTLPGDIFPNQAEEDKSLLALLNRHASQLRHCPLSAKHAERVDILAKRCQKFLEKATALANDQYAKTLNPTPQP